MLFHPFSPLPFLLAASFASAQNWTASPFIPPAIPLAVKTPYIQTWKQQGTADGSLNVGWATFRDSTSTSWTGMLWVDDKPFIWMGDIPQYQPVQKDVTITSTRTIFTVTCGTVDLTVTFLSPIEPTDLVNQSIPFSYLAVEIASNDGNPHQVELYTDITGEFLSQSDQLFEWEIATGNTVSHQFYLQNQTQFLEVNGRLRYGSVMYSTNQVNGLTYQSGNYLSLRNEFLTNRTLNNTIDPQFRAIDDGWPVFAFAHDLGTVDAVKAAPIVYTLGYVRDPLVQFSNVPNTNNLRGGYYLTRYSSIPDMVTALLNDYPNTLARAVAFDNNLTSDALTAAPQDTDYASILALSVRQLFGNIELTCGFDGTNHISTDIMAFLRDGSTNVVDIIYSAWPALLYTNPAIGRYLLEPVLAYQAANPVQGGYAIGDIGASPYPNVTGPSNENYPVEACGDQLIMALSYTQKTSDNSLITKYQSLYDQFATYLTQNGLYMASQYSADDFAGPLANQTNLAVKSIIALKAASEIFQILGNNDKSQQYNKVATSFLQQWQNIALSSDKSHYTISYGNNTSWGTLYNLYADRLLGFNMFPQSVYDTQTKWYASELNSFGLQLDTRAPDARTDWQLWTAATVTDANLQTKLISVVKKYASSRLNNRPFPDRYNSANGQMGTANDRTVVGGHFALLLVPPLNQGSTNGNGGGGNNNNDKNDGKPTAGPPVLPAALASLVAFIYALL